MKFDRFDDNTANSTLLPDGTHECEITAVKIFTRKSDGRELLVLTLRDADGMHDPVGKFLDPSDSRDHKTAMQFLAALGLPADADIDSGVVGRRVKVTTKRAVRDGEPVLDANGTQRIYVNAFSRSDSPAWEQAEPAEAKPVAKRTPTQKADAASSASNDDIPF